MGRYIDDTDAIVIPAPVEWFVDVVLTPAMLTTAPFYDNALSGPGLVVVPAPGVGKLLQLRSVVFASEQTKAGWTTDPLVYLQWGPSSDGADPLLGNNTGLQVRGMDAAQPYPRVSFAMPPGNPTTQPLSSVENKAITLYNVNNLAAFVISMNALNQGTKTFVFQGAFGVFTPGLSFTIAGSTGNNGTYTVVSSSTNDDLANPLTSVVVSQAIPNATADGSVTLTGTGTRRLFVRLYYTIVPTRSF